MSPSRPFCLPVPLPPALRRHLISPTLALWQDSPATTTLLSCNFWLLASDPWFPQEERRPVPVGRAYRPGFQGSHFWSRAMRKSMKRDDIGMTNG